MSPERTVKGRRSDSTRSACCLHLTNSSLGLIFNPEDRGSMFLPVVGEILSDYTAFIFIVTAMRIADQIRSEAQLLSFWTLSSVLFLFKTHNVSETILSPS
jgi:hypothetical protein